MSKSLTSRRRTAPWIHRWSRPIIGAIAGFGILNTAYLTFTKLGNAQAACPTSGCDQVLNSPYATVFGLPLALFGLLAYLAMAIFALSPLAIKADTNKTLRTTLENWTWPLLFIGATAMTVFSGYLMFIMVSKFVIPFGAKGICVYCIASAIFALSMLVLVLLGREWEDVGQLWLTGLITLMVTLIATLAVFAPIEGTASGNTTADPGPPITTTSTAAELALAKHLKDTGAKMYGAYWCSHCYEQKLLFGQQAAKQIPYIECAPDVKNSQPQVCEAAKITGYPTWDIKGQQYSGAQTLQKLAELSGYTGPRNFQNN
jgi:uncharacterized membrane protein